MHQDLCELRVHLLLVLGSLGRPSSHGKDTEHLALLGANDSLSNQPVVQRRTQILPESLDHRLRILPLTGADGPECFVEDRVPSARQVMNRDAFPVVQAHPLGEGELKEGRTTEGVRKDQRPCGTGPLVPTMTIWTSREV